MATSTRIQNNLHPKNSLGPMVNVQRPGAKPCTWVFVEKWLGGGFGERPEVNLALLAGVRSNRVTEG